MGTVPVELNGRNVPFAGLDADPAALRTALAKGPNVIAVKVVNGAASAGAIFRGQFDLRDGTRVSIMSDRTVKAATKADEGWQQVGFDDSAWKGPVWIGDAMCWPWSELAPMERFLSADEKAAWDRDDELGRRRLPPGLADEPEMDAKVVWKDGVVWISLNGELHMPEFNLVGAKYPWTASQLLRFRDIGIHFHDVQFESGVFWRDDGKNSIGDKTPSRIRAWRTGCRLEPRAALEGEDGGAASWSRSRLDTVFGDARKWICPVVKTRVGQGRLCYNVRVTWEMRCQAMQNTRCLSRRSERPF